jgi:hypothetical protein
MTHNSFKAVESIGRTLPGVEVTTTWGQSALKVQGRMFVCVASHKSAEPNTLVVMMDFADRDALVEDDPGTYTPFVHTSNSTLTDSPTWIRRIASARSGAIERTFMLGNRFSGGTDTVSVVTTSAMSS